MLQYDLGNEVIDILVYFFTFGVAFPIVLMWAVSAVLERSIWHILWGALGWLGAIIGLIYIMKTEPPGRP